MAVDTGEDGLELEAMSAYLSETDVVYAVLFGSRVHDEAEQASDVDLAVQFPPEFDDRQRFDRRNRIDAAIQSYADAFVDVSDVDRLPPAVARRALRDGRRLVGDEAAVASDLDRIERDVASTASDRERERREFLDRLAEGET